MGDSENVQPLSKKRAALKELSRDNPGLDDSDEDTSALESGTFKTASEEVLASRRIVRVKRRDPSAVAAAPSSNPFAGICFAAPVSETNKPLSGSNSTPVEEGKQESQDETNEVIDAGEQDKSETVITGEAKDETTTTTDAAGEETEKGKDDNNNINTDKGSDCGVDKGSSVDQTEKERKESEGTDKNDDHSGAFNSFHQHSTSKNAFTGLASTGFSVFPFSFGSTASGSGSLTQQSSFSFNLPNNGTSSIFGTTSITTENAGTTTAFPSKEDVSVETGEENERAAFTADSVLFEYLEGGWKERGKGEVKVNVSTDSRKARLVMRSQGNYRVILNASLYSGMKLASMDKKVITFACVNSISETKIGLSTFALKFKDPAIMEKFRAVIEKHKESKPTSVKAAAPLKTPENSPRAEEDA